MTQTTPAANEHLEKIEIALAYSGEVHCVNARKHFIAFVDHYNELIEVANAKL